MEEERDPAAPDAEAARGTPSDLVTMRADVSNRLAAIKKTHYGKGPVKVRTYIEDHFVFSVLEGGMTRNEETLLQAGEARLVREFRLRFQEVMEAEISGAIEQATGRRVVTYHSQVLFDPFYAIEIFVLDGPPGMGEIGAR